MACRAWLGGYARCVQVMVEVLVRRRVRCTQLALGALLLLLLAASCIGPQPRVVRARIAAPTLDQRDAPELAQAIKGTLVAARYGGALTLVDLPTRRELQLDLGCRVTLIAGPDEEGRIVYEAERPLWWEFFPLTLFTDGERRALVIRSLHTGREQELLAYRTTSYGENQLLISRRGGRVVYVVSDDLRVFDAGGGELWRGRWSVPEQRKLQIDDDGARLHFEQVEVPRVEIPSLPYESWPARRVSLELATGDRLFDAPALVGRTGPLSRRRGDILWWWSPSVISAELATRSKSGVSRGGLVGDLGGDLLELPSGLAIHAGLASSADGARGFRDHGPTEHSLRLGQRSTGKTLSLVRCFEPGAWCFSDVRVDPKLLRDPAPPRR